MCTLPDTTTTPIEQELFSPEQDIYVCGYLMIEKVDQRDIEIPLVFTWYYDSGSDEAMAVEYLFEADGRFTALLDKPISGIYRPGRYTVSIARTRAQLAERQFEIVGE
jgi:hypothetical protein